MEITPEIIQDFRDEIPYFSDAAEWPDDIVEKALCEGDAETGGSGWGAYSDDCHNFKRRGMFYYAAHWLTLMYPQKFQGSQPGNGQSGSGGGAFGAVSSKTVGDESISYAVNAVDAGSAQSWLSSTGWGTQFLMLKRRAGMGARVV